MKRQIFSAVLAAVAVFALAGAARVANDEYVIASVGVKFTAPKGWHLNASNFSKENLEALRPSNAGLNELLKKRTPVAKLIFTKYPVDYPSLNPTLQAHEREVSFSAMQVLDEALKQMSALDSFKVIEAPRALVLEGRDVATCRVTFKLTKGDETYEVEARSLVISHQDHVVSLGFSGLTQGKDRSEAEYQAFLKSLTAINAK